MIYKESAPAKINLFLKVGKKGNDGYHSIESVMQAVNVCDTVTVEINDSKSTEISIDCKTRYIPSDERNLAYKAALCYTKAFSTPPSRIHIKIDKLLPTRAGLGGGSSDAATVFAIMNKHFGFEDEKTLTELAASIGSDIPFLLQYRDGKATALARGKGEILESCASLPPCGILIAKGAEGVSTPEAYRLFDIAEANDGIRDISEFTDALESGDLKEISRLLYNSFESAIFPVCEMPKKLKRDMLELGAFGALMSGSGSAVFGIFADLDKAEKAGECLKQRYGNKDFFFHTAKHV
jgi:4-diphosphocytidyl-2-C-methyl-D-erythritol kinase